MGPGTSGRSESSRHMTYPKGHVIRLMKSSATGRNVTSLQSKFRFLFNSLRHCLLLSLSILQNSNCANQALYFHLHFHRRMTAYFGTSSLPGTPSHVTGAVDETIIWIRSFI